MSTETLSAPGKPQLRDWATLGVLVLVWGSAYAMTAGALTGFGPATLVTIRLLVGAAALALACQIAGARAPALTDLRSWAPLVLIGLVGTLAPFLLISSAQQTVPSAMAAIYIAAAPIAVAVMSHLLVPGEQLSARRAVGVLIGFVGVTLLFAPAVLAQADAAAPLGDQLKLLAAAICYGGAGILVRLTQPALHPLAMSFGFVICAAIGSLPLAGAELLAGWPQPGGLAWACAVGLGLGSTALGSLLYVVVIRRVGPVFMSNVGNLVPLWSLLIGAVVLNETLPPTLILGLGVILCGILLVQRR